MPLGDLFGLLWLLLFFLAVASIVFTVMVFGGLLVAVVSLPLVAGLPSVRRGLTAATESITGRRTSSLTDRRFLAVYVAFVETYGISLLTGAAVLATEFDAPGPGVSLLSWPPDPGVALAVVVAGGAVVVGARVLTGASARAIVEWAAFLGVLALLAGVAAIVVPIGLLTALDLVW